MSRALLRAFPWAGPRHSQPPMYSICARVRAQPPHASMCLCPGAPRRAETQCRQRPVLSPPRWPRPALPSSGAAREAAWPGVPLSGDNRHRELEETPPGLGSSSLGYRAACAPSVCAPISGAQ